MSNSQLQILIQKLALKALKKKRKLCQKFPKKIRARCGYFERNRQYCFQIIRNMTEKEFARMFRMSRAAFSELLKKVEPRLRKDIKYANRSSHSPITPVTKLLATIRWLAGGSYLDIAAFFGFSPSCFFHPRYFLWECMEAINAEIPLGFSFDEENLEKASDVMQIVNLQCFQLNRLDRLTTALHGNLLI